MTDLVMALLPAHAALATVALAATDISDRKSRPDGKYIIIERDGREYPILFPCELQHREVVPLICATPPALTKVVSAGFYEFISADQVLAGGESETLKLQARVEDAPIIKRHLLPQ